MPADMIGRRAVPAERGREDEARLVLREHVRRQVALPGLEPRIRRFREPEGALVEERRLLRVPYEELDVVDALQPERIVCHG